MRRQVIAFANETIEKARTADLDQDPDDLIRDLGGELSALAEIASGTAGKTKRLLQSSAEFVRSFTAPDYLINGLLQRRFL